ncbi:MAG: transposase [Oscillospiraceae bacterium]|nr:transposase [Oscillospiraceae bacterium]
MRKKFVQMSLFDVYQGIEERLDSDKSELFKLLDEHLDWDEIIPSTFYHAFYLRTGRKRQYALESFLRALFLQRIFHYTDDSQLLNTLRYSFEMRDFCGFDKVPDASKLTRFKQTFCKQIRQIFERLVDLTEPICREMDKVLADELLFDTTGIEGYVAENNPFLSHGCANGAHRSPRLKFVCPGAHRMGTTMVNRCENPCTAASFGRCTYVYPHKNLRLYPGISRDDPKFNQLYKHRTAVERTINTLKDTPGVANRKTSNVLTTKADLFLAGIVQLVCSFGAHAARTTAAKTVSRLTAVKPNR